MSELEIKHLPGRHNQKDHNPYKNMGEQVRSVEETDVPRKKISPLSLVHHYRRSDKPIGKEVREKVLKNGKIKRTTVNKYEFIDSITGKPVTDPVILQRIRGLVPPGVTDGHINADADVNGLNTTWLDSKNRLQRRYSKKHDQGAAAAKFERAKLFNSTIKKVRNQITRDLKSENAKQRELAAVVHLIDETGFRIGSLRDTKAEQQAYGATTLLGRHVTVVGNKVKFDFIGKKGVRIVKTVTDDDLAKIISERKTSQWSQRIFDVGPGQVRRYLKEISGQDFDVKDFRTWHATRLALKLINKRKGPAPTETKFRLWQKEVGRKVSKFLGNTGGVAVGSYIDYHAWEPWRKPEWGVWKPKKLKAMYAESWQE